MLKEDFINFMQNNEDARQHLENILEFELKQLQSGLEDTAEITEIWRLQGGIINLKKLKKYLTKNIRGIFNG